tara:strand:+ start:1511 stop:2515 length:1005 start_codon:yes stop_codon:yes gene_type:complete
MIPFLPKKPFDTKVFESYLQESISTNQFTNNGPVVQKLEQRAHKMLKISDKFAVVATSNGTTALHALFFAHERKKKNVMNKAVQDFTFDSTAQGPLTGAHKVDLNANLNFDSRNHLMNEYSELIIITNIFGHVQNLEEIKSNFYNLNSKIILFDNAATPYSFIDGVNSCCLCDGSSISLHHTKPLGFGEGGLMIVKKEMEADAREVINFGKVEGQFNERGGNYKMSDISAAAILQYWDSFDIDELASTYKNNYFKLSYDLATKYNGQAMPNFSDEEGFFPANLPFVFPSSTSEGNFKQTVDAKKYYKPLTAQPISSELFERTVNFPCHMEYSIN